MIRPTLHSHLNAARDPHEGERLTCEAAAADRAARRRAVAAGSAAVLLLPGLGVLWSVTVPRGLSEMLAILLSALGIAATAGLAFRTARARQAAHAVGIAARTAIARIDSERRASVAEDLYVTYGLNVSFADVPLTPGAPARARVCENGSPTHVTLVFQSLDAPIEAVRVTQREAALAA